MGWDLFGALVEGGDMIEVENTREWACLIGGVAWSWPRFALMESVMVSNFS